MDKHIAEVNVELRKQNPDASDTESGAEVDGGEAEWDGLEDAVPVVAEDEEFVDEDKYTTVTVEAMGEPVAESEEDDASGNTGKEVQTADQTKPSKKRQRSKDADKPKAKKKKFRYESKAERQATRHKQKSKSHAAKLRRTGK